jgi:hypothetical protein
MLPNRLRVFLIAVALMAIAGCQRESSNSRLIDLSVQVRKHEEKVGQIERRLEGIEQRLDELVKAELNASPLSKNITTPKRSDGQAADFRETPEYEQILAAIAAIQQQVNVAQSELSDAKGGPNRRLAAPPLSAIQSPFAATENPKELTEKLNKLVDSFGLRIEDPQRRQEFLMDVEQLRQLNAEGLSSQQLYDQMVAALKERWNREENEGSRKWIERQLNDLESSTPENLNETLDHTRGMENLVRLGEIRKKYSIPSEAMKEAGLPAATTHFTMMDGERSVGAVAVITSSSSDAPVSSDGGQVQGDHIMLEIRSKEAP